MSTLGDLLVKFRDENPAHFGTGEIIHEGKVYPHINAVHAATKKPWTPSHVGSIPPDLLDEMDDEHSRQAREARGQ